MLEDLTDSARIAAPEAFVDDPFSWPPRELLEELDIPYGQIEIVERPAGGIAIAGEVDPDPDEYRDHALKVRGLDTLAWYRSFHFGEQGWGIYITEAGVRKVAGIAGGDANIAFELLWSHEYFHFLIDIAATYIEAESGAASYLPHYWLRRQRPPQPGHAGWCHISEAMANGYALDQLQVRSSVRELRDWMRRAQPAGYKDGPGHARSKPGAGGAAAAERGRRQVMWHMFGPAADGSGSLPDPSPSVLDLAHWLAPDADVPLYWVADRRRLRPTSVAFITTASVVTTPKFDKVITRLKLDDDWNEARIRLARDAQHPGLHFKKLKGSGDVFSIRLGRGHRCLLRLSPDGTLVAEDADKRSDVYR